MGKKVKNIFLWMYFKFNEWRYGKSYGCGRCHHPAWDHLTSCSRCSCHAYSIERVKP